VKSAILGTGFTAFDILDVPVPPRADGVISVGSMKGVQYGAFVAALAQSTADLTGIVTSIARATALTAESKAGPDSSPPVSLPLKALRQSSRRLPRAFLELDKGNVLHCKIFSVCGPEWASVKSGCCCKQQVF